MPTFSLFCKANFAQRRCATAGRQRRRRMSSWPDISNDCPFARPSSLGRCGCELLESARRVGRTELGGSLIPKTSQCNVGRAILQAECLEHVRVERSGKRECCARIAGFGNAPEQKPRRREITGLDEIVGTPKHRRQFISVQMPGNEVRYRLLRRRLARRHHGRRAENMTGC